MILNHNTSNSNLITNKQTNKYINQQTKTI